MLHLHEKGYLTRGGEWLNERLGIVTPYAAQCSFTGALLEEALKVAGGRYVSTVHRFQGSERDTMICDLTDSTGAGLGAFLKATSIGEEGGRLLNVAFSRARACNLLVANCHFLLEKGKGTLVDRIVRHFKQYGEALDVSGFLPADPSEFLGMQLEDDRGKRIESDTGGVRVFNQASFYEAFRCDLRRAKNNVVILSPFLTQRGTARWVDLFRGLLAQGVRIRVVTNPPACQSGVLAQSAGELISGLRELGVVTDLRQKMHEKIATIDDVIVWHGSLNILSHKDTSESMLRLESRVGAEHIGKLTVGIKRQKGADKRLCDEENPQCVKCGQPMLWKTGKHGIWFECLSTDCGNKADWYGKQKIGRTSSNSQAGQIVEGENCPDCGSALKIRNGKRGAFLGCSRYPACKFTKNVQEVESQSFVQV